MTVVCCGLDHLSLVNLSHGRAYGDEILRELERRLREVAHPDDAVTWVAGDCFAIVCRHDRLQARALAGQVHEAMDESFVVRDLEVWMSVSIGIADESAMEEGCDVISAAEVAMTRAKRKGRNRTETFSPPERQQAVEALNHSAQLRRAIREGKLVFGYQPVLSLVSGSVVGLEATLRLKDPEHGLVAAEHLARNAEQLGLHLWMLSPWLDELAELAARLPPRAATGEETFFAIKVPLSLVSAPEFLRSLRSTMGRSALDPSRLMLEVDGDIRRSGVGPLEAAAAAELRSTGVRLCLDAFRSAQRTLASVDDLPVTHVRIDRRMVQGGAAQPQLLSALVSVLNLAEGLGLVSIADGVDVPEQAQLLAGLGCQLAQGALWGPAVSIDEAISLIRTPPRLPSVRRSRVVEPEQTESTVRKLVLSLHRAGASLHTIAAALNHEGLSTPEGTSWRAVRVARVIAATLHPDALRRQGSVS